MSDLVATNCNNGCGYSGGSGCSNIIWILLLLSCCGGNNGCGTGFGNIFGGGDNDCCSLIWILLLLSCCGGGSTFSGNNGCGCGC